MSMACDTYVLVCDRDLFQLNRLMTIEQRYSTVVSIWGMTVCQQRYRFNDSNKINGTKFTTF